MKKLSVLIFSLIFPIMVLHSQNEDFKNSVIGTIYVMPKFMDVSAFIYTIKVRDIDNKVDFDKKVSLMYDKKSWCSILAVNMSDNLSYVAGYAPVIVNDKFSGKGEFYLYKKENGVVSLVKHFIGTLREESEDNEIVEYLEESGYTVKIKEKLRVSFMVFKGYGWVFDVGYFSW